MSSVLQRRRRAKLNEQNANLPKEEPEEPKMPVVDSSEPIEHENEEKIDSPIETENKVVYEETEQAQDDSDIIDDINVTDILKEQEMKNAQNENAPNETDEFEQMLLNLFGGMMGGLDENGQPTNPEFTQFMNDFKEGFNAGYNASTEYGEKTQPQNEDEAASVNSFLNFFFNSTSYFGFVILFGFTSHNGLMMLLTLCAIRLAYLFFLATPYQAAVLSRFLGWILTMLNIITNSTIGDFLSVVVDSAFFFAKQYMRFRFQMFTACWFISYIPDYPYFTQFLKLPINYILLILIPLVSFITVGVLFVIERNKQRKEVLFLVNFISLFTNPEMQEVEIKTIIGNQNEIKDEEKLKTLIIDAYALYKNISKDEAETYVNMYYKRALMEYNRKFVAPLL